jgi:membrane protease YdiL (CAAX protease family)
MSEEPEPPPAPPPACAACGSPLRDGARFCARCGAARGETIAPPPVEARAHPAARDLAIALGTYFVCLSPLLVLIAGHGRSLAEMDAVEWTSGGAGLVGMLLLGKAALRGFGPPRAGLRGIALAIAVTAAVLGLVELFMRAVPSLFLDVDDLMRGFGLGLGGTLWHVSILPAVTEEIAFRGAVLGGLRGMLGDRAAIAASALCFAILHLSVLSLVHLTVLGVVLGVVRVRSGSLWPCMLIHGSYNAAIVLLHW